MAIQEKFPSIRPSLNLDFANTKTLDPRINFTRASTATYYDGKTVAKAEENLFLRSQEFNAGWIIFASSVSANVATAPDGTTTADKIVESSTNEPHAIYQYAGNIGSVYTVSVYVKADGRNFAFIGNTNHAVSVDLTTGVVSVAAGSFISTGSQDAGNGWWRVYFTVNLTFSQWLIYTSIDGVFANRSYLGDGTSGVLVWGAQLEQRSSVTAYTATTTQPITNYVPVLRTAAANVARFDHNPVTGESLGLLIEEQRTNLLSRSQEFISPWLIQGATVVNNAAVALDGSQTAALLVANSGYVYNDNNARVLNRFITLTGGTTYTWSIYAKAAGVGSLAIRNNWTGGITIYNLTDELTTANKQFIGNGWYRCFVTYTPSSTSTNGFSWRPFVSGATADGVGGVLLWGAQVEAGAFPTSYIKTEASQVTRSADHAVMTGSNFSSWYRQDEGSFVAKFSVNNAVTSASKTILNVNDGSENNRIWLRISQTVVDFVVSAVGQGQVDTSGFNYVSSGLTATVSIAYKKDDFVCAMDPFSPQTDTSGLVPVCDRLNIGSRLTAGSETLHGHIRKIAYYPRRLTNTQLQALTT